MKNLLLLTIVLIVSTSLCTLPDIELPDLQPNQVQQSGILLTVDAESPDVFLSAETSSSRIKPGRTLQVFFELRNKQTYDLRNVSLTVYDYPCFKQGSFSNNATLKANQSKMWTWKFEANDNINLETKCSIKFKTSYEADYSYFQDIVVLPENEYFQRESEGTLNSIPISSSSTNSPLNIEITFSEEQPFLENQKYYMYINYYKRGQGLFEDIDVEVTTPSNMNNLDCSPVYDSSFKLDKTDHPIKFIRDEATPTTCSFTASDVSAMNIKSLGLDSTYTYTLDNSISVIVA